MHYLLSFPSGLLFRAGLFARKEATVAPPRPAPDPAAGRDALLRMSLSYCEPAHADRRHDLEFLSLTLVGHLR